MVCIIDLRYNPNFSAFDAPLPPLADQDYNRMPIVSDAVLLSNSQNYFYYLNTVYELFRLFLRKPAVAGEHKTVTAVVVASAAVLLTKHTSLYLVIEV